MWKSIVMVSRNQKKGKFILWSRKQRGGKFPVTFLNLSLRFYNVLIVNEKDETTEKESNALIGWSEE